MPQAKFRFKHEGGENAHTICTLEDSTGNFLASGAAYLHPSDNFSRPIGRKISAGRAIRQAIRRLGRRDKVGAENRRLLWEQLCLQSPKTLGVKSV